MNAAQTLEVKLPSGQVFRRQTSKPYTCAVCSTTAVIRWCRTEALALKALQRFRELPGVCILPVTPALQPPETISEPVPMEGPRLLLEMLSMQSRRAYGLKPRQGARRRG